MRAKSGAFGSVLGSGVPRELGSLDSRIGSLSEPRAAPTAPQKWEDGHGARLALRAKSGAFGAVCMEGT